MDKHHDHHSSGFGNGFLLGLIVGAALVFFLFTEKGKKLFKMITEEGLAEVGELKALLDLEDEEEEYEDVPVAPTPKVLVRTEEMVEHVGKKAKRFFRGVPRKRVN